MIFKALIPTMTFALLFATPIASPATPPTRTLTAAEIVEHNVAARGGLEAWRHVQTMTMTGKLGVGGDQRAPVPAPLPGKKAEALPTDVRPTEEIELPFTMKLERPRKVRFELEFRGQTALQVYDGIDGWKIRPYLNRLQIEPYTAAELKEASSQADLDGPLVDYAAKGTKISLDGTEQVENRPCYKLALTLKSGQVTHVWVDARTFLEAKVEGQPRKLDGVEHPVQIFYRDYRAVNGLQIPFTLETSVLTSAETKVRQTPVPVERILISKVIVNPPLAPSLFIKPSLSSTDSKLVLPPTGISNRNEN